MLEFLVGAETHSSNWGKFYIHGLEPWAIKEDHEKTRDDNHHKYWFNVAAPPTGTVFTIFEQNGSRTSRGDFVFTICRVTAGEDRSYHASYGQGFLIGPYEVIAEGIGETKGPRLLGWWKDKPANIDNDTYAEHCAKHINVRGLKYPPRILPAYTVEVGQIFQSNHGVTIYHDCEVIKVEVPPDTVELLAETRVALDFVRKNKPDLANVTDAKIIDVALIHYMAFAVGGE